MRNFYRIFVIVFTLMLAWHGMAWGQMETIQQGVILHCFDWKYTDIQAELQNIKNAGFTAIQTSPAQKNYTGTTSWNTLYRPRNPSEIGPNPLGTKAELQALCTAAHQLGLKIIVDVVANHADGAAYVDANWQSSEYYHGWGDVNNWNDRSQVINGDVGGLRDINTGNSTVQARMKAYVQNLKSIGVDGIRWDAAKHIGLPSEGDSFWSTVPDQTMFNYGEILNNTGGNDATLIPEYLKYMSITDANYGTNMLLQSAKNGQAPSGPGAWATTYNSGKFVYWGESHDTYSNSDGASVGVSQAVVDRAYAIAASHNQIPALYLSRPSDNSTTDGPSTQAGTKGSTHFTSKAVAAVNAFHNAMDGKGDYYTGSGSVASVTRQGGGAIVVNFNGAGNVTVANGGGYATPGTYTDQVSGSTWTITSTTISGNTDGTGIAVLYNATSTHDSQDPVDVYEPYLESSNEISCFFETSKDNVKAWIWDGSNNYTGGTWPGESMKLMGKTTNGNNIFKWTYNGTLTSIPTNVIFTHDGETKFDDNNGTFTNHGYYTESSATTSTKTITKENAKAEAASVTFSPASGMSFTNTLDVTMTPDNAASAWYSTDGGTTKIPFTAQTTITIGNGVADGSTVTITWGATNMAGAETTGSATYTKESGTVTPSTSVLDSHYKTNPNGAGKKKTITVDGSLSDWDATDIIAQGAANDDPRVYKPSSVHEVPVDLYSLYGAYDDNNVYLAWEMTNVQDVVAPSQDFPLTQGNLWIYNLPFWIAFQTGNSSTLVANAKTPWDDKYITFQGGANKMLAISTNGANGPFVYDGNGNQELGPTTAGVTFKWGQGIRSSNIWGINGYGDTWRTVGDMKSGSGATYVDFNANGHSSSTMDMTYEMSIPLTDLGITATDIADNGLGVMLVATFGASGMDCLPYDLTMNDNAAGDYSADPTTTEEKEDQDVITSAFAYIGKVKENGDPQTTTPALNASVASGKSFTTETLDVTLTPVNATSYTYTYNGETKTVNSSEATTITIGKSEDVGSTITITWTATNGSTTSNGSLVYTKTASADKALRLTADAVNIVEGGKADLVVRLQNAYDGGAFTFSVALPDGIEVDADNGYFTFGDLIYADGSIGVLKTYQNGTVTFSGAPKDNLTGNTGTLVTIHVKASNNAEKGTFDKALSNITICQAGGGELKQTIGDVPNSTFKLTVSERSDIVGDVNGDGKVDSSDLRLTLNAYLMGYTDSIYDINKDGKIDSSDIRDIIDIYTY